MSKFEPGAILAPHEHEAPKPTYDEWAAFAVLLAFGIVFLADIISKLKH